MCARNAASAAGQEGDSRVCCCLSVIPLFSPAGTATGRARESLRLFSPSSSSLPRDREGQPGGIWVHMGDTWGYMGNSHLPLSLLPSCASPCSPGIPAAPCNRVRQQAWNGITPAAFSPVPLSSACRLIYPVRGRKGDCHGTCICRTFPVRCPAHPSLGWGTAVPFMTGNPVLQRNPSRIIFWKPGTDRETACCPGIPEKQQARHPVPSHIPPVSPFFCAWREIPVCRHKTRLWAAQKPSRPCMYPPAVFLPLPSRYRKRGRKGKAHLICPVI